MTPRFLLVAVFFTLPGGLEAGAVQDGSRNEAHRQHRTSRDAVPRSPFRDFHRDLEANFLGLFTRDNAVPALIGAAGAGAVAPWDDEVAEYFLGPNAFPDIDLAGDLITHAEVVAGGLGALLLARQSIGDARFREMAYSMAQALVLNNAVSFALKPLANRARPNRASQFSMPSAHSSNALVTAVIAEHYYGPVVGVPAYALAAFISVSRLEADEHFMSDLVVGSTLGYIVGKTVLRNPGREPGRRVTWMPVVSYARRELGVRLEILLGD